MEGTHVRFAWQTVNMGVLRGSLIPSKNSAISMLQETETIGGEFHAILKLPQRSICSRPIIDTKSNTVY